MRLLPRFRDRWLLRRIPPASSVRLNQRRIFIMPTAVGLMFMVALLLMLLTAINYQNSLAYGLTFLLGSLSGHHPAHRATWPGWCCRPAAPPRRSSVSRPCCASARRAVTRQSPLRWAGRRAGCAGRRSGRRHRGSRTELADPPPRLVATGPGAGGEPFRWGCWWPELDRLELAALVYPQPSAAERPLGGSAPETEDEGVLTRGSGVDDYQGLRAWQPGDPRRRLHWKAYSRGRACWSRISPACSVTIRCWISTRLPAIPSNDCRCSATGSSTSAKSSSRSRCGCRPACTARTAARRIEMPACVRWRCTAWPMGAMHECEAGYSAQQPDLAAGGAGAGDPAASHPSAAVDHRPVAGCAGWRIQIFRMRARYPRSWTKALLMIAAGFGVYFSRGSRSGSRPVWLLIAAFILKLVEMSTRRDALVLIFLGFFAVVTSYLFEDSLLAGLYSLFRSPHCSPR